MIYAVVRLYCRASAGHEDFGDVAEKGLFIDTLMPGDPVDIDACCLEKAPVGVAVIRLAVGRVIPIPGLTPIRPAIADNLSSMSEGISGPGGLGLRSAPRVVFARDGLLVGGKMIEARIEGGLDEGGVTAAAFTERGGGRGRGAHPVRRGRGLIAGRGEIVLRPGVGDATSGQDPAEDGGDDGSTLLATFADTGDADAEARSDWNIAELGGVARISTVSPLSLDVTDCVG